MLGHLVQESEFEDMEALTPTQVLEAKAHIAQDIFDEDDNAMFEANEQLARTAFATLTTPHSTQAQTNAVVSLQMPEQVQKLMAMLSVYDWEFVEKAKELRSYVVSRLMEESVGDKAAARLKALELLGKVTEVGLFTEQVKITTKNIDDETLDAKLQEKLDRLSNIIDVTPKAQPDDA